MKWMTPEEVVELQGQTFRLAADLGFSVWHGPTEMPVESKPDDRQRDVMRACVDRIGKHVGPNVRAH